MPRRVFWRTRFILVEVSLYAKLFLRAELTGSLCLVPTELALNMPSSNHALLNDTVELASDTIVWLTSAKRDWLAGRYLSCNWDMEQFLQRKEDVVKGDLLKFRLAV